MESLWHNESAFGIAANFSAYGAARPCTLSIAQMLVLAFLLLAIILGTIASIIATLWCALYSQWVCCCKKEKKKRGRRVAFGDFETDQKRERRNRFIEVRATEGSMIGRQLSPRSLSRKTSARRVVFQEVVDVHRSRTPSLASIRSSFNPLHRSVSLEDFSRPMARIALSSFSLDSVQTERVPRRIRAELFPLR